MTRLCIKSSPRTALNHRAERSRKSPLHGPVITAGDIFILDEPTSALDPLTEGRMFSQFENMINGKAAVLITHRLSVVRLADHVAVFDKGRMVEYGTHDEVYGVGGLYTEMYDKQAEFYCKAT